MRVFVSSVVSGYEAYRDAASRAITALGHDPVLMERGPAVAATPREACLAVVAGSDAVVVLLGTVYGDAQDSGMSATHEEFEHARIQGVPVLLFVERAEHRDERQASLISEAERWSDGNLRASYSTPEEVYERVVEALAACTASEHKSSDGEEIRTRAMSAAEAARRTLHTQGAVLTLAVAPNVVGSLIPLAHLYGDEFRSAITKLALFGDSAVFSTEEGTAHDRSGGLLRLSQRRAAVGFDEAGVLTVCKPVTQPAGAHLPEIISELLESDLIGCLRFASAVYQEVDQQRRARRVAIAATLIGADHCIWRTLSEYQASPNSGSIATFSDRATVVEPANNPVRRAALENDAETLAEELWIRLWPPASPGRGTGAFLQPPRTTFG